MAKRVVPSISDLPDQVREEDAAHMAGAHRTETSGGASDPNSMILLGDVQGHQNGKVEHDHVEHDHVKHDHVEYDHKGQKNAGGDGKAQAAQDALSNSTEQLIKEYLSLYDKMRKGGMNSGPEEKDIRRFEVVEKKLYKVLTNDSKVEGLHAAVEQYVEAGKKAAKQHEEAVEKATKQYKTDCKAATKHYAKALEAAKAQHEEALKLARYDISAVKAATDHYEKACKAAADQHDKAQQAAKDHYEKACKAAADQHDKAQQAAKDQVAKAKSYAKDGSKSGPVSHDSPVHKGSVAKISGDPADRTNSAPVTLAPANKTLSGQIGNEIAQLPKTILREAGTAALEYAIAKQIEEAEAKGTVKRVGTLEVSNDARPAAVVTKDGKTEISSTKGTYSASYGGAMAYGVDLTRGGAIAAIGREDGNVTKTVVKQDRGATVDTTETSDTGVTTAGARADAHKSVNGAKVGVEVKVERVDETGIKVSVTDKLTGITYSKVGLVKSVLSVQGQAKAFVTWERAGIKVGGAAGIEGSATGGLSKTWESGAGFGIAGTAKLKLGAQAGLDDGYSVVDAFAFSTKHRAELNFGGSLGLSPQLSTAVSTLVVAADAVLGKVGAHADATISVKDGKFYFGVDIGGAMIIGYNLKFDTQIDFGKWSDNISRHMQTPGNYGYPGQEFRYQGGGGTGGEALWVLVKTAFDSKPEPPPGKPALAPTANATEAATYYFEMLSKLARIEELRKLVREAEHAPLRISAHDHTLQGEAEGKMLGEKIKKQNAFFKDDQSPTGYRDPTLYQSFPSIAEISKAMQHWFPESKLPGLKESELTFSNRLPAGFEKDFKFIMDANGKSVPSTDGAFAIFAGLSLTQYLSIKEYNLISKMGREELANYLGKKGDGFETTARSAHLTDAAKQKLLDYWEKAFEQGALGNPYDKQGRDVASAVQPNAFGANVKDESFEAKFWELSRSTADTKTKQMQFGDQVREFNKYYYQTTKLTMVYDMTESHRSNTTVMKTIELPSGSTPIKDKTLGPQNFWTNESVIKFQGVPKAADGWHLIDLTEAKEGKIGLHDLIYKHTLEKLDSCRSPQAVYQFLKGSDWIADDGSKGELLSMWKERNMHGAWSTASDADAQAARAWYDLHKTEFDNLR